jgi:hypothetical protein
VVLYENLKVINDKTGGIAVVDSVFPKKRHPSLINPAKGSMANLLWLK